MKEPSILLLTALIFACGSPNETGTLVELRAQRDSLKAVYTEIGNQISDLQDQIDDEDTTVIKRIPLVSVEQLERRTFEHFFEVHGSVETKKNVTIHAEIPAEIKQIKVEVGQRVNSGQTLAILDTEVIQGNIDEVKTAYSLANTIYERQKKLWNQKIGSELQYLEVKSRKESLEQKVETLKATLGKAVVTAPFSGIVDEIFMKEGEIGNPMIPLLRLVNIDNIYIMADVSEDYINRVKKGTEVEVNFPALNLSYTGTVNRSGSFIKPNNRTFKVYVDLSNEDGLMKPNLLAILKIKDFQKDSAVIVSTNAIQQDAQGNEFLFITKTTGDKKFAQKVAVVSGVSYDKETLIVEGLDGNEELILKGARGIKDGQEIKI